MLFMIGLLAVLIGYAIHLLAYQSRVLSAKTEDRVEYAARIVASLGLTAMAVSLILFVVPAILNHLP